VKSDHRLSALEGSGKPGLADLFVAAVVLMKKKVEFCSAALADRNGLAKLYAASDHRLITVQAR
jgi:hypothetical protein